MKEQQIKFQGKVYLLVEGAITPQKDHENGVLSYAHLFDSGDIKRFNKVIGHKDDIEFLGMVDVDVKTSAMENLLNSFGKWE